MPSKTEIVPANMTRADLIKRAGANVPPERVVFDRNIFDGTAGHLNTPIESVDAYRDAVVSTFEPVERTESYEGFTLDELAVALDAVLNMSADGVPQVIKVRPSDNPKSRRVEIGYDMKTGKMRYKVVPAGPMSLPGFRNLSKKQMAWIMVGQDHMGTPYLHANTIRGDQGQLEGLFAFVHDYAAAFSIYTGQAIDTEFKFMNLTKFRPENVALTEKAKVAIELWVRQQFTNPKRLDERNQSPKTGLMLEGPPGGGKTILVSLCEYVAITNGGIVIHVDPALGLQGLARADVMARRLLEAGHTVMISFEDMEKLADQSRTKVLEILDGTAAKLTRRIIVGTTNFIEQIDRAMLRPGRFDSIIHCGLPDLAAFQQLVTVLIAPEDRGIINYAEAFVHFEGYSYATIANAVSIVIRSAIASTKEGDPIKVHTQDLINAALMVRDHHEMLCEKVEKPEPGLETAFRAVFEPEFEQMRKRLRDFAVDRTDYDRIYGITSEATDNVIEARLDGASVDRTSGRLSTNG